MAVYRASKEELYDIDIKTTTAAMAMEKKCSEEGIPGRLIPLPGEISAGCGLSWRILPEEYETYKDKIMSLDIPVEQTVEVRI